MARRQSNATTRTRNSSDPSPERDKIPVREKGHRTRKNILEAAVTVFERDGFIAARVADIVAEAGVAHGSFYTYFDSKETVFREAASEVIDEIYEALDAAALGQHARQLIRAANIVFLKLYERHAPMLALIEQVATFDEQFREMRLELRHRLVRRISRAIRGMEARDEINPGKLDRSVLAEVLAGMVENFAYAWFILKEPFDDGAVEVLDEIWIRVLGVTQPVPADG